MKSDAYDAILKYINWIKTQFSEKGYQVKKLFSDRGAEYLSARTYHLLDSMGIESHTTSAYTPPSNGVAERVNLTVMNDVRSMLVAAKLPSYFWIDATEYAVYLTNYVWNDKIQNSPAGYIGFRPLSSSPIHTFGEKSFIKLLPEGRKTDIRSRSAVYLGIGHRVFLPTEAGKLNKY